MLKKKHMYVLKIPDISRAFIYQGRIITNNDKIPACCYMQKLLNVQAMYHY